MTLGQGGKERFNETWSMKNIATQSDALHTPNYQK